MERYYLSVTKENKHDLGIAPLSESSNQMISLVNNLIQCNSYVRGRALCYFNGYGALYKVINVIDQKGTPCRISRQICLYANDIAIIRQQASLNKREKVQKIRLIVNERTTK